MSFHIYLDDTDYEKPRARPGPRIVSLLLHATAFFLLMHAPEIKLEPAKSEYKLAIEGKETKLVWYEFNKKLPAVTPPQAKAEKTPTRAVAQAPQEIVASRKDVPNGRRSSGLRRRTCLNRSRLSCRIFWQSGCPK